MLEARETLYVGLGMGLVGLGMACYRDLLKN